MEKLLYVDDEEINLQLFEINFRNSFNVITTATPADAIKIIEKEDIKVVITDFKMPIINGIQLIDRIKAVKPKVVCIILSGYLESDVVTDKSKVFKYLMKPYEKDELLITLHKAFLCYSDNVI